ncbi:MAG: hypothetical protein IJN74_01735 [Clostridia bacterium]|nr:hypothetical protein [Clostridia bacterium]
MFLAVHDDKILFQTPYNEKYDLVQKFSGATLNRVLYNGHYDFTEAGLMEKNKEKGYYDPWHLDVPFSSSTDDVPCVGVNGAWIGALHGQPCCITLYAPNHGMTTRDMGSVWKDEKGVTFTLLRPDGEDYLVFVSENVGTLTDYKFVMKIEGALTFVSSGEKKETIKDTSDQSPYTFLLRAYRFTKKRIIGIKDGKEKNVMTSMQCDSARLEEEYLIINPATVAPALTKARPEGGFDYMPDISEFGEPMISVKNAYHLLPDGAVLCEFTFKKLMDVHFERFLGAMCQHKLNVHGGGIHRYIPKLLPFTEHGNTFDFSTPLSILEDPYPDNFHTTPEYWATPDLPPDRMVDYFRDKDGHDKLCYSLGYLPIYDGEPKKRLKHLGHAHMLYRTRKYYPTFMFGDLDAFHGVAFKKFFIPEKDRASAYSIKAFGKTYIYMDLIEENTISHPAEGTVTLFEKSDGVSYEIKDGEIVARGKGYAVFITE